MNAIRSRCPGSMFAWILNTKPVSVVLERRRRCARSSRAAAARGASSTNADSSSVTPKLLIAEPKNTGVCRPARYSVERELRARRRARARSRRGTRAARSPRNSLGLVAREAVDHRVRAGAPLLRRPGRRRCGPRAGDRRRGARAPCRSARSPARSRCRSTFSISSSSVQRLAALAVELVDEGDDRRVAQPADLHQLDRPLLDALGAVDDHQRRVDRGQRAVGVLREVLVARACRAG